MNEYKLVEDVLDKIVTEIEDTGAYEQEVNGKTEFLEGVTYCLNIINKYKAEKAERGNNECKTKV